MWPDTGLCRCNPAVGRRRPAALACVVFKDWIEKNEFNTNDEEFLSVSEISGMNFCKNWQQILQLSIFVSIF